MVCGYGAYLAPVRIMVDRITGVIRGSVTVEVGIGLTIATGRAIM